MGRAGYSSKSIVPQTVGSGSNGAAASQSIGASVTNQVISVPSFRIPEDLNTRLRITILVASSTVAVGITAKLQVRISGSAGWVDSKTVAITTGASNTLFEIKFLETIAGDQTYLPLPPEGRLVITSGAGDSCVITNAWATDTSI